MAHCPRRIPVERLKVCADLSGLVLDLSDPANRSLHPIGGTGYLELADEVLIIVHEGDGEYVAVSALCPHQGCRVGYRGSGDDLRCPCHGATFDLGGVVTRGPATRDLASYPVVLQDKMLYLDV